MRVLESITGPDWRDVWRNAIVPCLGREALQHLLRGLQRNDSRLIRCANTEPPIYGVYPEQERAPCQGACPLAFALWQDQELYTAVEVEAAFVALLEAIGQRAGSKLAITPFLDWIDFGIWAEVRLELMGEIGLALAPAPARTPSAEC